MIPKIVFRRSWLYDSALKRPKKFATPPADTVFMKRIKECEKMWKKEGPLILKELEKVTKLKWTQFEIVCYVTWGVIPYSDPLTLNMRGKIRDAFDTLTHELIHRILSQGDNPKQMFKNWDRLMKKYKKYSQVTKVHIVIHAIHEHILRKFYGEKRLRHQMMYVGHPGYILAWDIVKKDGYKNIISDLTKGL